MSAGLGSVLEPLHAFLAARGLAGSIVVRRYRPDTPHCEEVIEQSLNQASGRLVAAGYVLAWELEVLEHTEGSGLRTRLTARVEQAGEVPIALGLRLGIDKWRRSDYLVMPSAVYAGNRFRSRRISYPPQADHPEDLGLEAEPLITDVPRLELTGDSMVQQKAGDLGTPAIGIRRADDRLGLWLLGPQRTAWGECVYDADENFPEPAGNYPGAVRLGVWCPGVRHDTRYEHCRTDYPSEDRGITPQQGDSVTLDFTLHTFEARAIPDLFDRFRGIRKTLEPPTPRHDTPVSEAYRLVAEKTAEQNWIEYDDVSYLGVGRSRAHPTTWQPGWVGGLQNTLPLLRTGDAATLDKVAKTFDFAAGPGQTSSGLFYGRHGTAGYNGDRFGQQGTWHLTRKSADALYFLTKQLAVWRERVGEPKQSWIDAVTRCAEAFVTLWKRHGQFGHFVDHDSLDMLVAHSGSAAVAPAGLALLSQELDRPEYLEIAKAAVRYQDERYVQHGYTTGGPGEACQCPDSESNFAQLESAVVLYEVTGEPEWIDLAKRAADLAASWCLSYDYDFPDWSEFGKYQIPSVGGVFANAQNKHGAPGICTFSGDSLLKLYRATGQFDYLDLLADIARCMPWCVSRPGRQIKANNGELHPVGWINERLNTSDWDHNVGGIFFGDCWCEAALMLSATEVPSVYIDHTRQTVVSLDHLEVQAARWEDGRVSFTLSNPTGFGATATVLADRQASLTEPLGHSPLRTARRVHVPAGGSVNLVLDSLA
ncbi:MAG: hypothetical protein AAGI68_04720 [Planctomycetota bacterium]